ncbi:MAG: NHLP family bacteriocin export ABC transporter peptidase/permease/ATPase subunit [Eggerthellaceae bacterium]|nr:NHLP family bacteriocin export ABC transporter peptidase/permease/ATPase subunit [Eggerthellaceae bacterium]
MTGRIAKVPQVMQMEALECGAACLTMILAYYGRWVPLEKVRADCGVSRDGSKASNVLKAARAYGLSAKGMTFSTNALRRKGTFPCIIFWNFNHFVVLRGFKGNNAFINDPARGQIKVSIEEFDKSFTGIVLVFERTDAFVEGGSKPDALKYARKRLEGLEPAIALVMLTAAITSLVAVLNTSLGKVFMDRILTGEDPGWLAPLIAVMLVLAILTGIVAIVNAVYLARIQGKIAVVSSSRFMRHLLHLPVGFYAQRMVGDLQQRQSMNESIAFMLIGQLAPVLVNSVMLILYLVVMLSYSVLLTLVGLFAVVANALLAHYIAKKRINISRASMMESGKLYATTVGGIQMIETIKAAGAERGYFERWAGYQASVNEASIRTTRLNEYLGMVPQLMTQAVNIAVLVLGIWLIVEGAFTPGMLLAFTGFLASFMAPVNQLINLGQVVQETETQMERVEDVMRYPADVSEEPADPIDASALDREKLRGQVDLKGVTFGYSPLEPPLIEGFDLHLEPGQWVALVGESGCGKSTIAKLVSGLYDPWAGDVCFDGVPLHDIPRPVLRGSLAVVDQDIVTFDDTVSDNIKLWDRSIEDYEVILACRDAGIHDVIAEREGGYGSRLLPGGRNYSGGQLQRLEIARVLAQDPTIIVLDEATSALDAQTEEGVINRIREREITCIVVSHRLSTIRDCDEIIVLDDGEVVERGTHSELMALEGAYAELVRND